RLTRRGSRHLLFKTEAHREHEPCVNCLLRDSAAPWRRGGSYSSNEKLDADARGFVIRRNQKLALTDIMKLRGSP
ncbi:hypothetical protein, partial [Pseudomonas silesiensis]|uniref:hypothetical protein n=1 Tax=Pseudomonas silesiensis TaxID=1853130 RepID=UPI0030DA1534